MLVKKNEPAKALLLIDLAVRIANSNRCWFPGVHSAYGLAVFPIAAYTGVPYLTAPGISASATKALLDIKKKVPPHSAMFIPFRECGYALMDIGDFATYRDGGLQGGMRSTLIV